MRELPDVSDWDVVIRCAEENAVAPLLYASLKRCGADRVPPAVLERLRIHYLRSDTANWVALAELESLGALFEREHLPCVVLKGGALAATLYPEPALRPMSDLDLLVPLARFAEADELLRGQGFASPVELCDDFAPQLTNYRAYTRGGLAKPAHLEIHWHLFKSPYYWRRVPIEWFWNRTLEISVGDYRARCFSPDAQFVHLAVHFALHHRAERLIWSYDLARLLVRDGARMHWDEILDAAERFGLKQALQLAAARVTETWGIPIPPAALTRLNLSPARWRDRVAFALMTARRGQARFVLDTLSQPTLVLSARFLWHHLFPARAYMRERYRVRDDWMIAFSYLWRFGEGILKFFRSVFSTITQH